MLDRLRHQRQDIFALARQFGARRIRVFGSVARGEDGPESDVDVLVDLPKGYDLFEQRLPLTEQLAALCRRSVEVVPEHELNCHIRPHVLAEAVDL